MSDRGARLATQARRGDLLSVQVLRGLAVIGVVMFHTHIILAQPEYGGIDVFGRFASTTWIGVNLFFVISGFIIMNAHAQDVGCPQAIPHYLWRRFTRLYPLYWVMLTAFIASAAAGLGHPDFDSGFRHLLSAYTLLPLIDMASLPLRIAWTLLFEVKFYLLFVLVLLSRRIGLMAMVAWAAAILIRNMISPLPDWGYLAPDWGLLHIWNIYFLVGMALWWIVGRLGDKHGLPILAAGLLLVVALCWQAPEMYLTTTTRPGLMLGLSFAFAMILGGAVLCEKAFRFQPPKPFLLLGDASYSIYLIHSATLSLLAQIQATFLPGMLPPSVAFIAFSLTAMGVGIACHLFAEKPLLAFMRDLAGARFAARPTVDLALAPPGPAQRPTDLGSVAKT